MIQIDPKHPFFAAAWRRYAVVMSCFIWAGVEILFASPFWAILFGAAGAYAFWVLIYTFDKSNKDVL